MDAGQIADLVINRLTAGGEVCLDIEKTAIEKFVHDAFLEACPWFDEPPYYVTRQVIPVAPPTGGDGTGGYVDLQGISPGIKYIRRVHTVRSRYYHTGDIVRDLLLLPAAPLETESIEEHVAWQMTWPMVKDLLGRVLTYKHDVQANRLWIDDAQEGAVTLEYAPDITSVEHVTFKKALNWIINMTEARALETMARVRGKFRGGLTMETDASDLASQAQDRMSRLQEELKSLHFVSLAR